MLKLGIIKVLQQNENMVGAYRPFSISIKYLSFCDRLVLKRRRPAVPINKYSKIKSKQFIAFNRTDGNFYRRILNEYMNALQNNIKILIFNPQN